MQIAAKDRIGVGGIGEWANGRMGDGARVDVVD